MSSEDKQNELGPINLIVIVLSIYVLGALVADTFFKLPPETSKLINYFDIFICCFFLIEFLYRFYWAESKLKFMRWGWIDLIASIPMVDYVRGGRILRLIRLLRVVRAFRSTRQLVNHVFKNKAKGTLVSAIVLALLMVIFSAIAMLAVETSPYSNIKTAEDALWWAYTTMTTVGYGDKYPVTTEGRIIAMVLMTVGVGIFGTFTAYVASGFVKSNRETEEKKS